MLLVFGLKKGHPFREVAVGVRLGNPEKILGYGFVGEVADYFSCIVVVERCEIEAF